MLRVKTKVDKSSIHGLGLFADQFIPSGTVTWEYDEMVDIGLSKEVIEGLDDLNRKYLLHFCYFDKNLDKFVLCADSQRYINHSKDRQKINIYSTPRKDVASKDIYPGEELLCDYALFDPEYFQRLGIPESKLI
jgi:SET domain-containing protein